MKRQIYFWHGETKSLREHLLDMSEMHVGSDNSIFYTGSLDDFEAMYKGLFMVRPDGTICVTQFNSFSPR